MKYESQGRKSPLKRLLFSVEDVVVDKVSLATGVLLTLVLIKAAGDVFFLVLDVIKMFVL